MLRQWEPLIVMQGHVMPPEVPLLVESLVAHVTLVRPLPGVDPQVHDQVSRRGEQLLTEITAQSPQV
ncbi:hypothetical protein DPMN_091395 [Dreissena polymorpha]|uniref:Uncharacterized protein n=1 Tax=Dreissena polymorpha TaxID=45954 RepID=A0A9D4KZY9_DREPO|nr:hypothetical protein DPMN_091395 [Dreissena polymorpha]